MNVLVQDPHGDRTGDGAGKNRRWREFPGGPVVRTLCFQCRGPGFDPWSGNLDPTSHMAQPNTHTHTHTHTHTKNRRWAGRGRRMGQATPYLCVKTLTVVRRCKEACEARDDGQDQGN